jgi:hypothetical protein
MGSGLESAVPTTAFGIFLKVSLGGARVIEDINIVEMKAPSVVYRGLTGTLFWEPSNDKRGIG